MLSSGGTMDFLPLAMLLCVVCVCVRVLATSRHYRRPSNATLPRGPRGIPIIGNMMQLGDRPHVSLARLAETYGPVIRLKLGSVATVVMSSPEAAKDVLYTYDHSLSYRSVPSFVRDVGHDRYSMVWLPPTAQWRQLRKIAAKKMLTSKRLDSAQILRSGKVERLLEFIRESCRKGEAVTLRHVAFITTMNMITATLFSVDFAGYGQSSSSGEFQEAVTGIMEAAGNPNLVDFFPVLRHLNLSCFNNQAKIHEEKVMGIFEGFIKERTEKRALGHKEPKDDVLDSLLDVIVEEKGYGFDEEYLKHLLVDLFAAGIDTTTNTTEWVMTELLRHPEEMAKAQREIRQAVGDDGWVKESDIPKLPYLQAVVKETLRLHPPAPFLLPRKAQTDVEILGHLVPKNTQIWVNVWAMGRDPRVWSNAHAFQPERFLEDDQIDAKGKDFKFIPFGGGRRICPGMQLGQRTMHLVVASLLHEFDWKLADGLTPEDMNMEDRFGITLLKAEPLRAIPVKIGT